jgi:hypothetical protein
MKSGTERETSCSQSSVPPAASQGIYHERNIARWEGPAVPLLNLLTIILPVSRLTAQNSSSSGGFHSTTALQPYV